MNEGQSPPPQPPPAPARGKGHAATKKLLLPLGWVARVTASGVTYFYCAATNQRTFVMPTRPATLGLAEAAPVPPLVSLCCRTLATLTAATPTADSAAIAASVPSELADACVGQLLAERLLTDSNAVSVLRAVGRHLRRFRAPHPPGLSLHDATLCNALVYCPSLTEFTLRNNTSISPATLLAVASACPQLRFVDVSECTRVDAACIAGVAAAAPHLLELACVHCMAIEGELTVRSSTLLSLSVCSCLHKLRLACPSLQHLDLTDCWDLEEIEVEAEARPALLYLFRCRKLKGSAVAALVSESLRELNVTECETLSPGLAPALVRCTGLAALVAPRCSSLDDAALTALASAGSATLEILVLNQCNTLTATGAAALRRFAALRSLTLPECAGDDTTATLSASLTAVDASYNRGLTAVGMQALLQLPRLASLTATDCAAISDAVLAAALPTLATLRVLSAARATHLSDDGLRVLAARCASTLVSVDLSRNQHVTDAGVAAITAACPLLHTVVLSYCVLITDAALAAIASGIHAAPKPKPKEGSTPEEEEAARAPLQAMRTVDVYGCELVTAGAVAALAAARVLGSVNCCSRLAAAVRDARHDLHGTRLLSQDTLV
eukprot:TRINITY_DN8231_c0_g1_i1.p1 TRINITY_DN8231_c0_g1~~TRINITY_DN8231_c0_g1_i1.p1  ORF type:complete len:613 (-),score=140.70 TRINITY_DN8231_c0_g1_i1:99-1937(-)